MRRSGRGYATGVADGEAMVLSQPLSFYGGVNPLTGDIIDHSHVDLGRNISGRILVIPGGKGSSSSSSVLAEAIRLGTGPIAILLGRPDPIMVVGCLVAQTLYGLHVPMIVCPIDGIADGDRIEVQCDDADNASIILHAAAEGALS